MGVRRGVKTGENPGGTITSPKTYELTLYAMIVYISENSIHLFIIYLFVYSKHEVHSMNTHSAERRLKKQTIQNVVQDIEAGEITGLQTLFATALKTES